MNHRERFVRAMNFRPVDRLPVLEWAGWWDRTVNRWREEGLPPERTDAGDIRAWFGLDPHRQIGLGPQGPGMPPAPGHGQGRMANAADYEHLKAYLFPKEPFNRDQVRAWAAQQSRGDLVVWISLEGFFWFPRTLLGIEPHLYAFYDQPDLIHTMNRDLLAYNRRVVEEFCSLCTPDFMTFAEDMSYNHGPMISQALFDEFQAPYYQDLIPLLTERGIIPFVDTDGNVEDLVPWFTQVGMEGFLPLERQAGIDIAALRQRHPRLKMIGAFDKTVMHQGETALRAEFERLLPVMRQGGYIPAVDHQTPPDVSLENYWVYVALLREYCTRAAADV